MAKKRVKHDAGHVVVWRLFVGVLNQANLGSNASNAGSCFAWANPS